MLKNNDSIKKLYNMFEAMIPKSLEELKQKAINEDWNAVFEQAHKLKGSLGIIQVKGILGNITAIESNARNRESLNEILPMIHESIQTYNKVIPMIRIEVEKKTA
jgi:HPt (histidine-containing phosphotransfer) domain-containing protein